MLNYCTPLETSWCHHLYLNCILCRHFTSCHRTVYRGALTHSIGKGIEVVRGVSPFHLATTGVQRCHCWQTSEILIQILTWRWGLGLLIQEIFVCFFCLEIMCSDADIFWHILMHCLQNLAATRLSVVTSRAVIIRHCFLTKQNYLGTCSHSLCR